MNSHLQSMDSNDPWGKRWINQAPQLDLKAETGTKHHGKARLLDNESRNEIASRRQSEVFKERSKLGSEMGESRLLSEDQSFKYGKPAGNLDFSAIFDENAHFLYGRQRTRSGHWPKANGLRRLSEADRLLARDAEWMGNPFQKRDHIEFEKGVCRVTEHRIGHSEIFLRELSRKTAKYAEWAEYHPSVDDLVLNRHRKPSKKLFLKEQKTFFMRKSNYFWKFNPILFDEVKPRSPCARSQSPASVSRTSRKKPFNALTGIQTKDNLPDSLDMIKERMGLTRNRRSAGMMSLNKVDGVKRMLADLNGKRSCTNFRIFDEFIDGETSTRIELNKDKNQQPAGLFTGHGTKEFNRRLSIDIAGRRSLRKQELLNGINQASQELEPHADSKFGASGHQRKHATKQQDADLQGSEESRSILISQLRVGELKLTPAKNISMASLYAYETPIKERTIKDIDEAERTSKKGNTSFYVGHINLISPSNFPSFPDILNSKKIKLLKRQRPSRPQISENHQTIRKRAQQDASKKTHLDTEIIDTLILLGPPRPRRAIAYAGMPSHQAHELGLNHDNATQPQAEFQGNRCFCKVTKCLKRYCSCFSSGQPCGPQCSCSGCSNQEKNPERDRIRARIKRKDPHAFDSKVESGGHVKLLRSGCRCSHTKCQKKYCECFRNGVSCGPHCRCKQCQNGKVAVAKPEIVVSAKGNY